MVIMATTNNGTTNPEFNIQTGGVNNYVRNTFIVSHQKYFASDTRWHLNTMSATATGDTIYNLGTAKPTQIIADCAYL